MCGVKKKFWYILSNVFNDVFVFLLILGVVNL